MRTLIFSDVHGNRFGLEAVLRAAAGEHDAILCLGDVVGYGAHPDDCCDILRDLKATCLLGNHDAAALGKIDISWFNPVAMQAILWTRDQLSLENRAWLGSLSPTYDNAEDNFQAVHASLRQPIEEYILGREIAQATIHLMKRQLCFYGHTHVADTYRCLDVPGKRYQMEYAPLKRGGSLQMEEEWRYLLNPGSCGQPRDGNAQARYALFDSSARTVDVFAIDYDWPAARDAIFQAGLPRVLGERLGQGQ